MILWMSAEMMTDVGEQYRICRKKIEKKFNELNAKENILPEIVQWAYIAMILDENGPPDYKEVVRRSIKDKTFEFRLKISHHDFKNGTDEQRLKLVIESLSRSVDFMVKFKVSSDDREKLKELLLRTQNIILST